MEIYFQLVNDAEGLKKACDELRNVRTLGFDVETTDLDPYRGNLRLVQLSAFMGRYPFFGEFETSPVGAMGKLREVGEPIAIVDEALLGQGGEMKGLPSPEELEKMSPNERQSIVRAGFETDLSKVSPELLERTRLKIEAHIAANQDATTPDR